MSCSAADCYPGGEIEDPKLTDDEVTRIALLGASGQNWKEIVIDLEESL
jgi:hypothetical protein